MRATSFDSRPEPPVLHPLVEPGTQHLASVDPKDSYDYSATTNHHEMLPSTGIPVELSSDEAKIAVQQAQRTMQAQQLVAFNQPQLMSAQPNSILGLPSIQQTHQQRPRMPWSVRPVPQHHLMLQPQWQQQQQQQQLSGHSAPTMEQSTTSVLSQTTAYRAFAELKATMVRGLSQIRAQLDQMSASIA